MIQPDTGDNTMWRMRIACWITKTTDSHSEYIMDIVFYGKNSCTNEPQCHVISPVPLVIQLSFFQFEDMRTLINKVLKFEPIS
jgi:hypothetical protein